MFLERGEYQRVMKESSLARPKWLGIPPFDHKSRETGAST